MYDNGLRAGQRVSIFQSPVTRERFEGTAVLVSCTHPDDTGDGLEIWEVRFSSEPNNTYLRTIYTGD